MEISKYRIAYSQICGVIHANASRKKKWLGKALSLSLATQETIRFLEPSPLLYRPLPGPKTAGISVVEPHLCFIHLKQCLRYSFESC